MQPLAGESVRARKYSKCLPILQEIGSQTSPGYHLFDAYIGVIVISLRERSHLFVSAVWVNQDNRNYSALDSGLPITEH